MLYNEKDTLRYGSDGLSFHFTLRSGVFLFMQTDWLGDPPAGLPPTKARDSSYEHSAR